MLLIVEGVDRTGKSTLCERLRDSLGGDVLHFDAPTRPAIDEYVRPLLRYVPGDGRHLFVDRHYLGETVWPTILGRESRMSDVEHHVIELFLVSRGAACVLAHREPWSLERACAEEPCAGKTREAQSIFVRQVGRSLLPWWFFEHGNDLSMIVDHAGRAEDRAATDFPYGARRLAREAT